MFGLPVRALHLYRHEQATFRVRVASLVNIVNQQGEQISAAETVTVLNDLCVMAPGALVDPRLSWGPIDDRNAGVTFINGPHSVTATLVFNEHDELVDFVSDDRPDSSSGTFIPDAGVPRFRLPGDRRPETPHQGQRGLRVSGGPLHLRCIRVSLDHLRPRCARHAGTRPDRGSRVTS